MMRHHRVRRLLSLVVGRGSIDRDVDAEMRFHIQMRVEDLMRARTPREDAERQAMREYGDVAAVERRGST